MYIAVYNQCYLYVSYVSCDDCAFFCTNVYNHYKKGVNPLLQSLVVYRYWIYKSDMCRMMRLLRSNCWAFAVITKTYKKPEKCYQRNRFTINIMIRKDKYVYNRTRYRKERAMVNVWGWRMIVEKC